MLSPRRDVLEIPPSIVAEFVQVNNLECAAQFALATAVFYFSLTTMDKEIRYFWRTPRKLVSIIYFMNRYIGIFSAFAGVAAVGNFAVWARSLCDLMTILLIDLILILRVLAIYSQSKKLTVILVILFSLEGAVMLSLELYELIFEQAQTFLLLPGRTICLSGRDPGEEIPSVFWAMPLLLETVLLTLALYKAIQNWQESREHLGILKALVLDQILYFLVVSTCSITKIIAFAHTGSIPVTIVYLVLGSASPLSILGSWLLIHLKESSEKAANAGATYHSGDIDMSRMEFV